MMQILELTDEDFEIISSNIAKKLRGKGQN